MIDWLASSVSAAGSGPIGAPGSLQCRLHVEALLTRLTVHALSSEVVEPFAQLKTRLMAQCEMIGPFDLLIAAHALSLGATLVTNNRREFDRVPGLPVENWP